MNEMNQFTINHGKPTYQSDKTFDFLTYTQALKYITGSPWDRNSGSLADVRKKVGEDLVDDPGMPEMIFTKQEVVAAELRAEYMNEKYEDLIVTLVIKSRFKDPIGTIQVESMPYYQLSGRVTELNHVAKISGGSVFVISAYSEETKQEFWWNDLELGNKPRLPGYDQKYDRKRKTYRNTIDGVIR